MPPRRLFGSRQRRVRGPYHEQGVGPHLRDVRIRGWHLLLGLLYIRGAIQLDFGKGRRAAMDCQDHDLLGCDFCVIRFRAIDFRNIPKLWFLIFR